MNTLLFARVAVALVWLYQGLWCKLLAPGGRQEAIVAAAPLMNAAAARLFTEMLGAVECGIAVWMLSGLRLRTAAVTQAVLLIGMNACGLLWARNQIADPAGMLLQNFVLITLAWTASATEANHARHA